VNALGWTFSHSEFFVLAVENYVLSIDSQLKAATSETDAETVLLEKNGLESFVAAALRLQKGDVDPTGLPAAIDGMPIPNYHVLAIEKWRGYYRLDPVAKVGVGVLALHEGHKLEGTLRKALEETLSVP
jgi:hypothetical protein